MKITCEICGDVFDGRANQKYCPECGKNPERTRKNYAKAERMLKEHAGDYDTPVVKHCSYCGKEFATFFGAEFCSETCKKQYRIENAVCSFCGKNLFKLGIIIEHTNGGLRFCSDKCRDDYKTRHRRERGIKPKICPNCRKEFDKDNSTFCSRACYEQAVRNGWRPDSVSRIITINCKRCKKPFEISNQYSIKYCPDCRRLIKKHTEQKYEQLRKKQENLKMQQNIEKNGLCFYCNTTHFNCERMRSNFIYYPEGAKVVNNKVMSCPSYTERRKK